MSELVKRLRDMSMRTGKDVSSTTDEAADRIEALEAENARLLKLLRACRGAMVESQRYYGTSGTDWGHMVAAINAALKDHP